jgi:hypothetical protein
MKADARREERLKMLEKQRVAGVAEDEACQAVAQKFKVSLRQAHFDVGVLLARLEAKGAEAGRGKQGTPAVELAVAVKRRERIFQETLARGDAKLALEVEKDRCRLLSLYEEPAEEEEKEYDYDAAIERELARLAEARQAGAAVGGAGANGEADASGAAS